MNIRSVVFGKVFGKVFGEMNNASPCTGTDYFVVGLLCLTILPNFL